MMLTNSRTVVVGLMGLVACCGCQSLSTGSTVRGQSPAATPGAEVYTNRHYHQPVGAAVDALQDSYHEHHNTDTYYYTAFRDGANGPAGAGGYSGNGLAGNGLSGASYANAPCEQPNSCPPSYGECPPGYGGHAHGGGRGALFGTSKICPDGYSYGYQVPNDLRYPQPNAVGGAVVYPYYTHRGPSDFFRQD
jgi:hypothetical protein